MSLTSPSTAETLLIFVDAARNALDGLLQLLLQEQELLTHNKIDFLAELSSRKQLAAVAAEQAGAQLRQQFNQAGMPEDADVAQWLTDQAPAALEAWQDLREIARKAELYNRNNGLLIDTRRQLLDQFISQLASSRGDALSYSPRGQLNSGSGGRLSRDKV
ncbi:flagellar export chaperone FlgN [Andreprevotia chitinilytica]|uniref:flagellar export chaperone FlgN n=1 Tax=Andreprevotia chitinilytica TaxID=396808 RepID=UPI0005508E91|nr:flagellar export chaperone FlgN [Andreprevotia chitinilytica]